MIEQNVVTYDGSDNVFIFGSSTYGVFGQNKFGDSASTTTLYSVLPENNIFVEYFTDNRFIDDSSTGTLNSDQTYDMTTGQMLVSKVIAKLRSPIRNVTIYCNGMTVGSNPMILGELQLGITEFGGGTASLLVSNDGGSNWVEVQNFGQKITFSTSADTDELLFKISANENITISDLQVFINK